MPRLMQLMATVGLESEAPSIGVAVSVTATVVVAVVLAVVRLVFRLVVAVFFRYYCLILCSSTQFFHIGRSLEFGIARETCGVVSFWRPMRPEPLV